MGTLQALSIIKDGYTGKFYPVHPREKEIMGHKSYSSVAELPEPPDLAFLVVPSNIASHQGFGPSVMFGFGGIFTGALGDKDNPVAVDALVVLKP